MLAVCLFCLFGEALADSQCINCHEQKRLSLNDNHYHTAINCSSCHLGDSAKPEKTQAHEGMIVSPGELENAAMTCGSCHGGHVSAILNSRMHTGSGIVKKTRQKLNGQTSSSMPHSFQTLGHDLADSLLRKMCASCHLGNKRDRINVDAVNVRGGGCLACHISVKRENGHPILTATISDENCFGCHSRSGRISLNYAGLAEVEPTDINQEKPLVFRLSDGRHVIKKKQDVHHVAGMSCIDCHTGTGLMNLERYDSQSSVDISCNDCHDNKNRSFKAGNWPPRYQSLKDKVPFEFDDNQLFLQTASGTPLWHIKIADDRVTMYSKLSGRQLDIPQLSKIHVPIAEQHKALSCDSCHATWVPRCLGCHVDYDPDQLQWDHIDRTVTEGRWLEKRWDIETGQPTLGWSADNQIDVFIPGMVMTLDHPQLKQQVFLRHFASLSPHTSGKAKGCKDCHQSSVMLGLGEGNIKEDQQMLEFSSRRSQAPDGLPVDAWTSINSLIHRKSTKVFPRPLSKDEIYRIYKANIDLIEK